MSFIKIHDILFNTVVNLFFSKKTKYNKGIKFFNCLTDKIMSAIYNEIMSLELSWILVKVLIQ